MENVKNNSKAKKSSTKKIWKLLVVVAVVFSMVAALASVVAVVRTFKGKKSQTVSASATSVDPSPIAGRYPFTSVRKVAHADVANLSTRELRIMRNEIFARYGYIFDSQDMKDYFMAQDWYDPSSKSVELSDVEKYNVEFIKAYEQGTQEPCGRFPFTSTRKVTFDDVAYRSSYDLRIMRNEIYARHGYIFDSQEMNNYFMNCGWYTPVTKDVQLSAIEKFNVDFIKQYE